MNILLFLIPLSLLLIGIAAWIFVWAVRHGQFEDLDTPALDVLRDEPLHATDARVDAVPDDTGRDGNEYDGGGRDDAG